MKKILIVLLVLSKVVLYAQDIHYSQFYSIPSNINPAFTGFINNDYFVAANYKTQWSTVSTPYQTVSGVAELSLVKNKHPNSIIGIGTEIIHDWAGTTRYSTDIFNLNISFLQVLDAHRYHTIGVGFKNGIAIRKFDLSKATFGNQFNGFDGFDQTINPIENGLNTKQLDYNLAIGGVYSYSPKPHKNFYFSFSAFNLVRPNISFYKGQESRLFERYVFFTGGEVPLKQNWSLLPSAIFQTQGPHYEVVFGSFARYGLVQNRREKLAINIGLWYRYLDALIPTVKLEYKGMNVVVNYDINISKLTKVSKSYGSAEISISYSGLLFKEHKIPKKPIFCPAISY